MKKLFHGFHLTNSNIDLDSIKLYHDCLDKIIPTWLEAKVDGNIVIKRTEQETRILHKYFTKENIIPLIQNYELDSDVSNRIVEDEKVSKDLVRNILSFMKSYGYQEVNINLEGVKYENKEKFTTFINIITEKLHNYNYKLGVTIPAKSENNRDSTWSGAYDYKLLGEIVDSVIIMAYDFHWPGGSPGPIAPIDWVKDVIDFAIIEIPLKKLYLAIGLYGYDWVLNYDKNARGVIYNQIENILKKYSIQVEWDQDSQSPYFRYKDEDIEHEVWFENKASISRKIQLAEEYQLAGVACWRLGQEDPKIWQLFKGVKKR